MINKRFFTIFLLFLYGCSGAATNQTPFPATNTPFLKPTQQGNIEFQVGGCKLSPFVAPTVPAEIPYPTKLDETTGLHMTGKVQVIDLATYRLAVTGKVDTALSLSLDDLRCMPKITVTSDLTCYGVFNDSGTWSGVPIRYILEQAGVQETAQQIVLRSADGFFWNVPVDDALNEFNFLAYEMEGEPLPILHGFPLRAVFPNEPGGQWVKWLVELAVE